MHMGSKVLISGATGFIAGHTIANLLEAGHTVIGTVRGPANAAGTAHLRALPGAGDRLRLVAADLLTPGAFDQHAAEVDYVIHMASPFHITVKDRRAIWSSPRCAVRSQCSRLAPSRQASSAWSSLRPWPR
jgi:nucleoside-diphosphate-sugar epimerase